MAHLEDRGVGPVDAAEWRERCKGPHSYRWKANVYRGTELLAEDLPITGGTLTLDSSDPVRRHLTLEIGGGERWEPHNANSPMVPFGQRITLWVKIDRADGTWLPWLKMGEYQIFTHSFERPSMATTVECHDMSGAVDEYLLLGKRSFEDMTVKDAIVDLVEEAVPGYVFSVDASAASDDPERALKHFVADSGTSRWEVATEIARRRGHECFFNSFGNLVIRRDVTDDEDESIPANGPDIGTVANPVAIIKDGRRGNLIGLTATVSREGGCNGVRINLHSTVPRKVRKQEDREAEPEWEDAPIHAHVLKVQEDGPVEWGGLFGRIPIVIDRDVKDLKRWSNGGEETWSNEQQDAHRDAKRMLHRRRGLTRYLDVHCLPMPWIEPDDKVRVQWDRGSEDFTTEAHFVQRVELDLNGGPMVLRTRSLNVTDPG